MLLNNDIYSKIYYINANGVTIDFTDYHNIAVLSGFSGYGLPDFSMSETVIPYEDIGILNSIRTVPREISVPIFLRGSEPFLIRRKMAEIMQFLSPDLGEGKLYIERPTGEKRFLKCIYKNGLDGNDKSIGKDYGTFIITFRAVDPYFYNSVESSYTFTEESSEGSFLGNPFFPIFITQGAIYSNISFINTGDGIAYPVWTITGVGDSLVLRNLTTGKFMQLDYTISEGEIITIDTRIGYKSIVNNSGINLMQYMASLSSFWLIEQGTNVIRVELSNSGVNTAVKIDYYLRYKEA